MEVFHSQRDREVYLNLFEEESQNADVSVLAYCLMTNYVHWIVLPNEIGTLATLFRRVQGRYAQYFNLVRGRSGHLWQSRYFSCPMSRAYVATATRYVEWNPIRAGMVAQPEEYRWSLI